jgi:hypothetical protein
MITVLFFDLIQVLLGNKDFLRQTPSENEWKQLFALAREQSLVGVLLEGVSRLQTSSLTIQKPILL